MGVTEKQRDFAARAAGTVEQEELLIGRRDAAVDRGDHTRALHIQDRIDAVVAERHELLDQAVGDGTVGPDTTEEEFVERMARVADEGLTRRSPGPDLA